MMSELTKKENEFLEELAKIIEPELEDFPYYDMRKDQEDTECRQCVVNVVLRAVHKVGFALYRPGEKTKMKTVMGATEGHVGCVESRAPLVASIGTLQQAKELSEELGLQGPIITVPLHDLRGIADLESEKPT